MKNADGQWQSRTEWHRVLSFGKLAEYARTLGKGSQVMVQGPVCSREYERDGIKHCVADRIAKLERAERRQDTDVESVLTAADTDYEARPPTPGSLACQGTSSP